jgi:hypothetical protein
MLPLLLLKAAEPGGLDLDGLAFGCAIWWLHMLVCWAVGYYVGSRYRAALTGGALGCGFAMLVLGILYLWNPLFSDIEFQILVILFVTFIWIWGWSAAGYRVGAPSSRSIQGGWWGGILGPIGLDIFRTITSKNTQQKP